MKPYPPRDTLAFKFYAWAWWAGEAFNTVKGRLERHPKLYPLAFIMEFTVSIVALWFFAFLALGFIFLVLTQQPLWVSW